MRLLLSIPLLLTTSLLHGQGRTRTVETDSGRVVLHYYTTGQLSTKEWTDKDQRWGRSLAYDRSGREIFNYHTRWFAGHASAHFEYHPNGAVSKVEVSDAPDGGIQWYRSVTTFDAEGNRTGFSEQGHDNEGLIPRPGTIVRPVIEQQKVQQVVECQKLFVNEVFVVNPTKWTCKLSVFVKDPSPALTGGTYTIGPKDTLWIGSYTVGERFEAPDAHVQVSVSRLKGKGPYCWMARYRLNEVQVSPEQCRYYWTVHGWTSTKLIW
ncbi:MAG: hypothetical protein IT229_10340 [Flavobacteriales bacterium]|nr:hypothetical protein [Flavobacteriales bacterium]